MNYRPLNKTNKGPSPRRPYFLTFAFIGVVLILQLTHAGFLGSIFRFAAYPFWKTGEIVMSKGEGIVSFFRSKNEVLAENERLAQELELAASALLELEIYRNENEQLKEMLGRIKDEKRVIASILVRPPRSLYDTLILDAGHVAGVKKGDAIAVENVAIGEIIEASGRISKAKLYSTPGEKLSVLVGSRPVEIEIEGRGGGMFRARMPKGVGFAKGETAVLPGLYPKIIASVSEIESEAAGSFDTIFLRTPFAISELKWVEIISSKIE